MRILFPFAAVVVALFAFSFTRPVVGHVLPAFPGGDSALKCHYKNNLNTKIVLDSANSGLYVVAFTVDTSGKVVDPSIAKAPAASTQAAQKEILRVTNLMPKWVGIPGEDIDPDDEPQPKYVPLTANVKMRCTVRFPEILDWKCAKK